MVGDGKSGWGQGKRGGKGKEKEVGGRMQTGRKGKCIPREPKQIIQKIGEKQNKMDKQEKNRKPVNQGKSYM